MTELTTLPARLLLQIREGERHNVLLEFEMQSRRQIDNPDGTHDHEVAMSSLVGGLSAALRNAIGEMEMDPETVKWLREMRDWIFLEVAP